MQRIRELAPGVQVAASEQLTHTQHGGGR